jgi:thiol-disulfide isomerase/thioredoxin
MTRPGLLLSIVCACLGATASLAHSEKPRWYQHPSIWVQSLFSSPATGARAPALTVRRESGTTFSMTDVAEEHLLISFWASWCPPCREELPVLSNYAAHHPQVKVLAVNVRDDSLASRRFVSASGLKLTFLFDVENKTADAYGISSLPANYLVESKTHRILHKWAGSVDTATLNTYLARRPR